MSKNQAAVKAAQSGRFEEAEKLFIEAFKDDPQNEGIFANIIRIKVIQNKQNELLNLFEKHFSSQGRYLKDSQAAMAIAEIAIQANHNETASQILEHVIDKKYHPTAAAIHSSILLKENKLTKARHLLIQYIEEDPYNPELITNLAIAETELGNYEMAETLYKRVVEIRPNKFLGLYNMSRFMLTIGQAESAQSYLNKANQAFANTAEARALQKEIDQQLHKENLPLGQYFSKIENKDWQSAKDLLFKIKDKVSEYKWLAAACELPKEQLKELSIGDRCDPTQLVHTHELIDKGDSMINDLIDTIEADETLTWNRASKPTTGGYQTHEILKHKQSKAVQLLKKKIKDQIDAKYTQAKGGDIEISGWGVVLQSGGYQKKHTHTDSFLSGVIYLSVPPRSGNKIKNAGALLFTGTNPLYIKPEKGLVVLFPSYLPHETIPYQSNAKRICIAFNIKQKDVRKKDGKSQQTQI